MAFIAVKMCRSSNTILALCSSEWAQISHELRFNSIFSFSMYTVSVIFVRWRATRTLLESNDTFDIFVFIIGLRRSPCICTNRNKRYLKDSLTLINIPLWSRLIWLTIAKQLHLALISHLFAKHAFIVIIVTFRSLRKVCLNLQTSSKVTGGNAEARTNRGAAKKDFNST